MPRLLRLLRLVGAVKRERRVALPLLKVLAERPPGHLGASRLVCSRATAAAPMIDLVLHELEQLQLRTGGRPESDQRWRQRCC